MDFEQLKKNINDVFKGQKMPTDPEELKKLLIDYMKNNQTTFAGKVMKDQEVDLEIENDFEGYSDSKMRSILEYPFEEGSPIKLHKLSDSDYADIPILRQIKHLVGILQKEREIKLTNKGNLPTRIVKELYPLGIPEHFIEIGASKLSKEIDSEAVILTKALIKFMRIVKIRNNVMTLTNEGEKTILDSELIMKKLMFSFCCDLDKSFLDNYQSNLAGNVGIGVTLILLSKYGKEQQPDKFYADRYFYQIPIYNDFSPNEYKSPKEIATSCYSLRTFDHMLLHLGLVKIQKETDKEINYFDRKKYIVKTELFDKLISVVSPQNS